MVCARALFALTMRIQDSIVVFVRTHDHNNFFVTSETECGTFVIFEARDSSKNGKSDLQRWLRCSLYFVVGNGEQQALWCGSHVVTTRCCVCSTCFFFAAAAKNRKISSSWACAVKIGAYSTGLVAARLLLYHVKQGWIHHPDVCDPT